MFQKLVAMSHWFTGLIKDLQLLSNKINPTLENVSPVTILGDTCLIYKVVLPKDN